VKSTYLIYGSNVKNLNLALSDLTDYKKFHSILRLRLSAFPILGGLIVTSWDDDTNREIHAFCYYHSIDHILIRHDTIKDTGHSPMGGYTVALQNIEREVKAFLTMGRIVFLLFPSSPFNNLYSLNSLFINSTDIVIEVVGPGFDASDLQRGKITPHEIFQLNRNALIHGAEGEVERALSNRIKLVSESEYSKSILQRLDTVYYKLAKSKLITDNTDLKLDERHRYARETLLHLGYPLLLNNEYLYKPITKILLLGMVRYIVNLPTVFNITEGYSYPYVLSCSYVDGGNKLVFWDVTASRWKYRI